MNNPLVKYYRIPKLYVKLPSQAQFYPENSVITSANNDIAVYPLTAMDQILLKTPDALLNGETLLNIIQNCVPAVKDIVRQLVEPDINTLLLAIRIATNGPVLEHETQCPACQSAQTFNVDLNEFLDSENTLELDPNVNINDELVIHVRPFNFEQRNIALLNELDETKAITLLNSTPNLNNEIQAEKVSEIVLKMTTQLFALISKSVVKVTILETGQEVTDPEHIREFITGISKVQSDAISTKIKALNKSGITTTCKFKCEPCGHAWDTTLDFDPISFFD